MILYTLKNGVFQMDVYEDHLVFRPNVILKYMQNHIWGLDVVVPYHRIQKVELHEKIWPLPHHLDLHTSEQVYRFHFRTPLAFFHRLAPYLERQAEKYRHHPEAFPRPMKTVMDLIEEKRQAA